jgi:predicted nuclease of restriction endonuclease-like RecB superfamily
MIVARERRGRVLLPRNLLAYELQGGWVIPHYLGSADERWIRALVDELDALVGRTRGDADRILAARLRGLSIEHRVPLAAVAAVRHLLEKEWRHEVKAAAPPGEIRRVVFELASDPAIQRSEVLARAAAILGIRAEEIPEGLFADRPSERRLTAPEREPSVEQIVRGHNLALAQGLLLSSRHVIARVTGFPRFVVRMAKQKNLLFTCALASDKAELGIGGPLALTRSALKYGLALAQFFPALALTPDWSIDATCHVDQGLARFHADGSDPIDGIDAIPPTIERPIETKLVKDLERSQSAWAIRMPAEPVDLGGTTFLPDLVLERDGRRALVEILGFYTAEYLQSKLRALREARVSNAILCVDESLACADENVIADEVVRFRQRVDAARLLETADRRAASATEARDTRREPS